MILQPKRTATQSERARSAVATSPVVEHAHPGSIPDERVSHGVFLHICFVQFLDTRVTL